jgi:hypothetical protein
VVHDQGALAGIELAYNGMNGANFTTRETPLGPSHLPIATFTYDPMQARAMDCATSAISALASHGRLAGEARRLRHRLCLCRRMVSASSSTFSPALQPPLG